MGNINKRGGGLKGFEEFQKQENGMIDQKSVRSKYSQISSLRNRKKSVPLVQDPNSKLEEPEVREGKYENPTVIL